MNYTHRCVPQKRKSDISQKHENLFEQSPPQIVHGTRNTLASQRKLGKRNRPNEKNSRQRTRLLQATGPPSQATGPPWYGAGVGVGMLRGAEDSLIWK